MQRIDVASAVPALPAPAAAGIPGYFTGGDPVGGTPATVLDADWANMVQEELMAIVLNAGIEPSKTSHGQVLAALLQILGVSANLAGNGHIAIPIPGVGTFILNWGASATTDASGAKAVTWDLPFPNACLKAWATNAASGPPTAKHGTSAGTKTGVTVYSSGSSDAASPSGVAFNYFGIGW